MKLTLMAGLLSLCVLPAPAFAQSNADAPVVLTPFIGDTTGGESASASPTVAVTIGVVGHGWVALEGDLGWSPEFFEQNGRLTRRTVLTQMANAVVHTSLSGAHVRPFLSGG